MQVPEWATIILNRHLPANWKLEWLLVAPTQKRQMHGVAFTHIKLIQISSTTTEETVENKYMLLHEISHGLRGPIPKPAYRTNRVSHDDIFFRIAAKLYISYDMEVMLHAIEHEYSSGKKLLESIMDNLVEFMANPYTCSLEKKVKKQEPSKEIPIFCEGDTVSFPINKKGKTTEIIGIITKIRRKTYQVYARGNMLYKIPFEWQRNVRRVEVNQTVTV